MGYTKTIVCFANSRKTSGRCVAGKELVGGRPGPWFRPISARPNHEISLVERRYQNGRDPDVLHVLKIPCLEPQPLPHQPENHLIDPNRAWTQTSAVSLSDIDAWLDRPTALWASGDSGYAMTNNRIRESNEPQSSSLYLIHVDHLDLLVGPKYGQKRIVRGKFSYAGVPYCLSVTDPVVEASYLPRDDGEYNLRGPILCVSLGDPYEGYFYKLIAAVLYEDRF